MGIKSDAWIRRMSLKGMIDPFCDGQVKQAEAGHKVISYGLSSYGYDLRVSNEFKVFTNVFNTMVDPKAFDEKSFVDIETDICIVPPNSFALARSVEYFRIPRDVLTICLGKSTYARCGIIVNVTPLEPEWKATLRSKSPTPRRCPRASTPTRAWPRCSSSAATKSARPATPIVLASTCASAGSRSPRRRVALTHPPFGSRVAVDL
jgi:dCTP deaminase